MSFSVAIDSARFTAQKVLPSLGLAEQIRIRSPCSMASKPLPPRAASRSCRFLQRPLLFKMDGEMLAESKTFRELQIASGDLLILV